MTEIIPDWGNITLFGLVYNKFLLATAKKNPSISHKDAN